MANYNSRSFTLIETLIVSAIIVVMSGISIAVFTSYKDDRVLNAQVSLFTRSLDIAKSKAAAGDVSLCTNSQTAHVNGYKLIVDPTGIKIQPGCDTVPTPLFYSIPANIIIPTLSLQFDSVNYRGMSKVFQIKNTETDMCKFVRIDETGFVTNGDCRSCVCPTP